MSKNPEKPGMKEWNKKWSFLNRTSKILWEKAKEIWGVVWEKAKEIWWDIREEIYKSIHLEDIDDCPYSWLVDWDVFKLLDSQWNEILEADDVKYFSTWWRIFHSGSGWWLITNKWTIVEGDYVNMSLHSIPIENHEYPIAIWEDQKGKKWYISIKDWLVSEDMQTQIEQYTKENPDNNIDNKSDRREKRERFQKKVKETVEKAGQDIKENFDKFADIYKDGQYNRVFGRRFSLEWWTKEGISYMKKWKVWIYGILKAEYENVAPCSDKYIWVMLWKKRWLVDADGNMLIEPKYDEIHKDGRVEMGGKYWLVNIETWEEIIEPKYDKTHKDGRVEIGGKCWLVNMETWEEIIEPKYDKIYDDGLVEISGKYWIVNMETWEEIIKPKYDKIYDDGRMRVGNEMWLVNRKTGEETIKPKYDIIFKSGRTLKGGKEWFVNIKRGIEILTPDYDDVLLFKWYSVVIPVYEKNYGLVSKIDWSVIKGIEFDAIRRNYKNGTITLVKKGMPEEVFDCSLYKEAA